MGEEFASETEALSILCGKELVKQAYSSSWTNKVEGLEKICARLSEIENKSEQISSIAALLPLLRRRFRDGLKAVFCPTIDKTIKLIDTFDLRDDQLKPFTLQLLPLVTSKLGDSNAKINEKAHTFVLWLASKDKTALADLTNFATTPPRNSNQYQVLMAKLQILKSLIEKYGLDSKQISTKDAMKQILPACESRKPEVRQCALDLLSKTIAPASGPNFEKIIRPYRQIQEQLKAHQSKNEAIKPQANSPKTQFEDSNE